MKKLFTLVVVVLMVVGAKAQTEIVVGPKVGLNMTNISNFDNISVPLKWDELNN